MSFTMATDNHLLASLSLQGRNELAMRAEKVVLEPGVVLSEPGRTLRHVYFPTSGFISQAAVVKRKSTLGMGLIGREGLFGISSLMNVNLSPMRTLVQGAGEALRLRTFEFRRILEASPELSELLHRYLYVLFSQLTQMAICTHTHHVNERLARWLLMVQDRVGNDRFLLTHALLAELLGVRRSGISTAAAAMQSNKLISYSRGNIIITDREALEDASCDCYQLGESTYKAILGTPGDQPRFVSGSNRAMNLTFPG